MNCPVPYIGKCTAMLVSCSPLKKLCRCVTHPNIFRLGIRCLRALKHRFEYATLMYWPPGRRTYRRKYEARFEMKRWCSVRYDRWYSLRNDIWFSVRYASFRYDIWLSARKRYRFYIGAGKIETIAARLSFSFRYDRLPETVRMENRRNKPQNTGDSYALLHAFGVFRLSAIHFKKARQRAKEINCRQSAEYRFVVD